MKKLNLATPLFLLVFVLPSAAWSQRPKPQDRRESPEITQQVEALKKVFAESGAGGVSKAIYAIIEKIPDRESTAGLQQRRDLVEAFIDFGATAEGQTYLNTVPSRDYFFVNSKIGEYMDAAKRSQTYEDQKSEFFDVLANAWIVGPATSPETIRKFLAISAEAGALYPEETYLTKGRQKVIDMAATFGEQRASTKKYGGQRLVQRMALDFQSLFQAGKIKPTALEMSEAKKLWRASISEVSPYSEARAASNMFSGAVVQTFMDKSRGASPKDTADFIIDFHTQLFTTTHLASPLKPNQSVSEKGSAIFDEIYLQFRLSPQGMQFEMDHKDRNSRRAALKQYLAEAYVSFIGTLEGQNFLAGLDARSFYLVTKLMMRPEMYRTIPAEESANEAAKKDSPEAKTEVKVDVSPDVQMTDLFLRTAESWASLQVVTLEDVRKFFILNEMAQGQEGSVIAKINDAMVTGILLNDSDSRMSTAEHVRERMLDFMDRTAKDSTYKFGFAELDGVRHFTGKPLSPNLERAYEATSAEMNKSAVRLVGETVQRGLSIFGSYCYGLTRKVIPHK